jgi:hypothetical protein
MLLIENEVFGMNYLGQIVVFIQQIVAKNWGIAVFLRPKIIGIMFVFPYMNSLITLNHSSFTLNRNETY